MFNKRLFKTMHLNENLKYDILTMHLKKKMHAIVHLSVHLFI